MDFWDWFFLLLIYIPLVMIWAFALLDIFRRDDLSGLWKAVWVAAVILVPFLGTLAYLIVRPSGVTAGERALLAEARAPSAAPGSTAHERQVLSDLHDRGKLTDEEFQREKARVLGGAEPARV